MIVGITGASGFIGSRLCRFHQERGDSIRALSRKVLAGTEGGIQWFQCDLTRPSSDVLQRFCQGCDVLYHCAGEIRDHRSMYALHVSGTKALVDAAAGRIGRWIQLSSTGAYGRRLAGIVDEETPEDPGDIYEATKVESDRLVRAAAEARSLEVSVLRPSVVIGPGMPNRSVHQLIRAILSGRFFFIGREGAVRNFVHVQDVVRAMYAMAVAAGAKSRIYNLSDCCTMEQFVAWACEACGRVGEFRRLPQWPFDLLVPVLQHVPGFPLTMGRLRALTNRAIVSRARIESDLSFLPSITLKAAITELAARTVPADQ